MRRVSVAAAAITIACLAGCKPQPVSELVVAVSTDMSLPKDIDTIEIQVSVEGDVKYLQQFERLGTKESNITLPATLGLLAPPDPTDAVDVIVDGRTGGQMGDVRVLREEVTTVPVGSIVTLDMPLHFLCLGTGEDMNGTLMSTCPDGQTCIAGTCVNNVVMSSTLDDYGTGSDVFGSGGCFDGVSCWANPTVADLDMTTCSIPPQKNVNVALQTEGIGICGPAGCFVTLDANSPEGWQLGKDGSIDLPPAVCMQITQGKIVNVVTAPVSSACEEKNTSLPTCGPWSGAKQNPPPYTGPVALAGGQPETVSLAVDTLGDLYWINAGLSGGTNGVAKTVGPNGGAPTLIPITSGMLAPRDMLVTSNGTSGLPTPIWSSATPADAMGNPTGTIYTATVGQTPQPPATALYTNLSSPEGLAVDGSNLFWTDFQTNTILMGPLAGNATPTMLFTMANYPYRIVADDAYVYWVDEGTTGKMPPDGAVESFDYMTMSQPMGGVIPAVSTPRAIALQQGPSGTVAIWYATFEADGALLRAPVVGGVFGTPVVVASALSYPNGIAVDASNVYWTNRGSGTVQSLPLDAMPGATPTTLATQQLAPGTIAVDDTYVYWVNAGASTNPSGGVIKLPKPSQ